MQLQLILQFRGDARKNFDLVDDPVALLAETLGDTAELDSPDVGTHGANVFLFTDDARATFDRAVAVFPGAKSADGFASAYRQICSDKFRVIWPPDSTTEFRLR